MDKKLDEKLVRTTFEGMTCPVGYLAPDGKWFLLETTDDALAHLALSKYVYDKYKAQLERVYGPQTEQILEHGGFIKVHDSDVRYFAKISYGGYYDQGWCETPSVTDAQIEELCKYGKKFGYGGELIFNDESRCTVSELKQMDAIMRDKLFTL